MWGGIEGGSPVVAAPGSGSFIQTAIQQESTKGGEESQKKQGLSIEDAADLCVRYRPLAFSIAGKYINRGVDLDDLRSAGLFGLVIASKRFDPDRGIAFGGYAKHWIRGQIQELFKPKGGAPGRAVSLDAPTFTKEDDEGNTKLDLVTDASTPIVTVDLSSLDERERAIFGARIHGKKLREIGSEHGLSGERARQINEQVGRKVRTTKGNVARQCIRDLISRRGYKAPSRQLLPFRSVKYPCRTYTAEEVEGFIASRPDLEGPR